MAFQFSQIQRYLSPSAYQDLDVFLEKMPMRAGHGLVIAGGIAWAVAGCAVLFATMQAKHVMSIRADILKAEALKPTVPVVSRTPVEVAKVQSFAKELSELYPQITVTNVGSKIEVKAPKTEVYGAFREAVGHMFNGGAGWRVNVDNLCVGRECTGSNLQGRFSINQLRIDKPNS